MGQFACISSKSSWCVMPISDTEYFRYLPISDYDKRWGIYVTGVGRTSVPPFSKSYPVSVHPNHYQFRWENGRVLQEYQALYILRGSGEFESATVGNKKVLPGSLMLLFPSEWHRYRPLRATGWDEYWISFGGRHVDDLVRHGLIAPDQSVLHTGVDDAILHPYLAALDRVRTEPIGYQQLIAVNALEIVASALAAVRRQRSNSRAETIVREAKVLLEQHTPKIVNMERLSAHFQLSEKHFRRVFKAHTGLSPYQYYLQIRIHRAKEMLLGTTLSIKQIAASLHFETPFHFSAVFKKKAGMSPSRWRSGGTQ
jgi:AraC-like DNA-binding protein